MAVSGHMQHGDTSQLSAIADDGRGDEQVRAVTLQGLWQERPCAGRRPDILVIDVNLPGVRGDQVAQQLRERIGRQVPVLFITGNNDFELPDWPSVRLIRKPFELPDFTKMVLGSLSN